MEAMDNPSYFTLPGSRVSSLRAAGGRILRIMGAASSSSSTSSSVSVVSSTGCGTRGHSAPPTPTSETAKPLVSPLRSPSSVGSRRSFRSLLPTLGSNRNNRVEIRQFVLGHPRIPADTAPSVYSESTPIPHKGQESRDDRRNSGRDSDFADDMVYYNLPAPPTARSVASEDEVSRGSDLTGDGDARYYNLCAGGRRRHSIGTFVSRERVKAAATAAAEREDTSRGNVTWGARRKTDGSCDAAAELMSSHKSSGRGSTGRGFSSGDVTGVVRSPIGGAPEHTSRGYEWRHHVRKRCHRCSSKGSGKSIADMDDILIISSRRSQVAHLWANFLKNCFGQISKQRNCPPFKMLTVCLEDLGASIPLALEEKMAGTRLQIVIICPLFLEHLYQHPEPASAVGRHLTPERVIAMLLGVDENSISEEHRAALISYNQWKHLQVKNNDTQFVADFLNIAMGILSRTPSGALTRSERAAFSVMPKKVKEGHNKVVVLLVEPLEKEDELCINVDKSGEMLEVTPVKRKNQYTVTFAMPASCLEISMLVGVHIKKNGKSLGCRQVKCESRMGELDQILRSLDNPLEFMCQTLGCSPGDRDQLDNFLLTAFQRNLPPHFNLLNRPPVGPQQRHYSRPEEYPTLLHFAARYGLEKLAWQLLECPGGEQACDLRNVCELTPAEMAEKAGHSKLANLLKGYLQMSEFSCMYSYLKMVCQNQSNTPENLCETDYHKPRPLSETYQVPPSARPLPTISAESPTMPMNQASVMNGYMEMHPAGNGNTSLMDNPESEHQYLTFDEAPSNEDSLQQQLKKCGSTKSHEQLFENPQDELAEIISYFKNNVLTLAEVEKLVENWRNRNDVQKSIKDKEEQLDKMRSEYERLQRNMKGDSKSARPLEKIRHFFKSKGKEAKEQSLSNKASINFSKFQKSDALHLRPASSLSVQSATSSSSSEPVSIASGCSGASLGDSGTHSDPEDRKGPSNGGVQNDISNPGNELSPNHHNSKPGKTKTIRSYEVPPAPRPVNLNLFLGPTKRENPNSVENRPPLPLPRIFPNDCETLPAESDDYITPPCSATQQSPLFIQTISYTNIDPHVNKVSTTSSRGFQSVNETDNENSINSYGESVEGSRNNHSQCFNEQLSPETPSSPELSIDENDVSFPNYTNIVPPSFSVHSGDVFELDVPPPLPPRLE